MNLRGNTDFGIYNQQDDEGQGPEYNPLTTVAEAKPELKQPSLYRVVLLNDDYTPMEFVVEVLMTFFAINEEKATQVMLAVHQQGKGVCGIYSRDVAETKATQVNQFSRQNKHPLLCEVEKV